jgi:hypothetical protein
MKATTFILAVCLFGFAEICFGQQDSAWGRWNWLVGEWVGEGSGATGQGTGWFSLMPDLNGKILVRKNHSEYPATADKPGIIHDDLMVVSLDNAGHPDKAVYFDNEGHTINYSVAYAGPAIVLTSGKSPQAPYFRLTYVPLDSVTVNVRFEMSRDGEKYSTYTEGRCKKKR